WKRFCRTAERLGYDALFFSDHLNDALAPLPALAAAASCTTTLRVGTLVLDNDFRHPALQAKEIATLDVLSDGRAIWGMGAGWLTADDGPAALPFASGPAGAAKLEESVALVKRLFAKEPVTHTGEHYEVRALDGRPKPVQRPHPPLLVGAAQERLLRFAGREAD